jgi:hypothetical protein
VLLALLVAAPELAAEGAVAPDPFRVRTEVDARRIGLQDTLEFQVEVSGTGFTSVEPPDLTGLRDFEVLDGPRRVQRQSIINGRFSASVELLWTLGPRAAGRLTIPALPLRVDGAPFRTDPVEVEVVAGSVASRVPAGDRAARDRGRGEEVLLLAEADRRSAYVGQQIRFTLRLRTRMGVRGMAYQTRPDFGGFWLEEEFDHVEEPPARIEGREVEHEGRTYQEYVLFRAALFPTASGSLTIDPINLQLRVRADRDDRFGSFFFDREETILRRSAPIRIEVRPLPPEGRPETFTGAVGGFRLEVATDRAESVVNEAVSLSVRVAGAGNIRAAGEPVLPRLADFRPFDPTVTETEGFEGGRYEGSRTWDYVLVPLAPGEQSIPPITFSYFDPEAGRYRTLRSEPIPLRIARAEGPELPTSAGLTRREVTALRRDIHFIKAGGPGLRDRGTPFHRGGAYVALLLMPVLVNAALLAWRARSDRLRADVARRRSLGARRAFRSALRRAGDALRAGDPAAFHAAVAGGLSGLVADKCNLAAAGLTRDRLREALRGAGVEPEVCDRAEAVLDACDAARFAPVAADPDAMRDLLARAQEIGRRIEGLR